MADTPESIIEIAGDGMSAGISLLGAELRYLRDGQGRDLLWDGDPAFWAGRAPLLFPIVGALVGDTYRLDGRSYAMPKHGFARRRAFTPIDHQAAAATFRLEADDETRAIYPFEFRLDIRFSVTPDAIGIEAALTNGGDRPMPASFGFHPALRWPLPYGQPRTDHRITFAEAEPAPIRRLDGAGLVDPQARPSPIIGNELALNDSLFVDDAIILDRLASRRLRYGARSRAALARGFFPRHADARHLDEAGRGLYLYRAVAGAG